MNTVIVSRWGNSLALRIPKGVIEQGSLKEGDALQIESSDGLITLQKVRTVKRHRLKEILGCFHTAQEVPELDWGESVGKEILEDGTAPGEGR